MSLLLKPFRWLFSLVFAAGIGILLLILLALASAGLYMPWAIEKIVDYRTGFPMTIKDSRFQLFTADIGVWDVLLQNPERFPERGFVDLKALLMKANPVAALQGKIDIDKFVLDLNQITWVKNAKGETNLNAFLEGFQGPTQTTAAKETKMTKPIDFKAKSIVIKIGKVVMIDYSGSEPITRVFTLNYARELNNINSLDQLMIPLSGDFAKLGVQFLTQSLVQTLFNSDNYKNLAKEITNDTADALKNVGHAVGKETKGLFDVIKNIGQ